MLELISLPTNFPSNQIYRNFTLPFLFLGPFGNFELPLYFCGGHL